MRVKYKDFVIKLIDCRSDIYKMKRMSRKCIYVTP